MYGLAEYQETRREAATVYPAETARAKGETRPYVVRDLSWELARFLDTQDFPESALATPNSAS